MVAASYVRDIISGWAADPAFERTAGRLTVKQRQNPLGEGKHGSAA
jgi:hypothetical protein